MVVYLVDKPDTRERATVGSVGALPVVAPIDDFRFGSFAADPVGIGHRSTAELSRKQARSRTGLYSAAVEFRAII